MVAVLAIGILIVFFGIMYATDRRDRPKPQLPVKPQATFLAEEVITVSRRRTVKATRQ